MPQQAIIFLVVMFVALILGMMGVVLMLNRREAQRRSLSIIAGKASFGNGDESAKDLLDRRRADLAKKLQQNEAPKTKKTAVIRDLLRQAGVGQVPVKHFWFASLFAGILLCLIAKLLTDGFVLAGLMFAIGFLGLPRLILKIMARRRQKKFLEELPDALESMVRLLKAGMPIGEAISMVSREFTGPVGEEMSKVYDEQKIGISLAEACQHAAERMPITEMQMFATGITIQQQTGSSLSEILTNLARVIRSRFRLKRKVQALSSEAKSSAAIIGALPILVASGLYGINPEYMLPLFITAKGKMWLTGAGTMMAVGSLVMRQMINFKV